MKTTKFIILCISLILALCMVGCDANSPTFTASSITGTWVLPEYGKVSWYWVLGENGILKYYELKSGSCTYNEEDKYVYQTDDVRWDIEMEGPYIFDTEEQTIFFSGLKMGTIEKMEKDKAYMNGSWLKSGICYRIKGFKDIPLELKSISFDNKVDLSIGLSYTLKVIYYPARAEAIAPEINWTSSDPSIASVDKNGTITAKSIGKATITAECGALRATCDVEVLDGVLNGKFSVSSTSQVQFSRGNLQYQASTKTWRFAEHQYDIIGEDNKNISYTYSGWIDLFGWGTGNNPTLSSTSNSDYSTFTDWGVNPISNGGNKANQWRTLTNNEWGYLYSGRTNAKNLRSQATVNNVHGYIFLPDSWSLPSGLSFTADAKNWTTNTYSVTDWAKMVQNGAVFLPAAGFRRGTDVYNVGSSGYFWSSTPYDEDYAYYLGFNDSNVYPQGNYNRSYGRSVRLVR